MGRQSEGAWSSFFCFLINPETKLKASTEACRCSSAARLSGSIAEIVVGRSMALKKRSPRGRPTKLRIVDLACSTEQRVECSPARTTSSPSSASWRSSSVFSETPRAKTR